MNRENPGTTPSKGKSPKPNRKQNLGNKGKPGVDSKYSKTLFNRLNRAKRGIASLTVGGTSERVTVMLADRPLVCDIANSLEEKVNGMQIYSSISPIQAMWFPYNRDYVSFHMGAVRFPIDIIFFVKANNHVFTPTVRSVYNVKKIAYNVQPGDKGVMSSGPVDGVLEVMGGYCELNNIIIGDELVIGG